MEMSMEKGPRFPLRVQHEESSYVVSLSVHVLVGLMPRAS